MPGTLHQNTLHAKTIFGAVYKHGIQDFASIPQISDAARKFLQNHFHLNPLTEEKRQESKDGTTKFLWFLEDGEKIESVWIPQESRQKKMRTTLCISSQVGCAMGCKFCLTATQGLKRNLSTAEIVAQVYSANPLQRGSNIVFMGMGEPLHNLNQVLPAIQILLDDTGFNFSRHHVTVSTSGLAPAILRLAQESRASLAVSLNAPPTIRSSIMPINTKYDLSALLSACREFSKIRQGEQILFEYVLLDGINDQVEDARSIASLLEGIPCKINLIPFNPFQDSAYQKPSAEKIYAFQSQLMEKKFITTVRQSRGPDILAACGQLRTLK